MAWGKGKKKIQITNDENTGQAIITNGKQSRIISKDEERELLGQGGEWINGNFQPYQSEWEIKADGQSVTLSLIPGNEAAEQVVQNITAKRRGLFG